MTKMARITGSCFVLSLLLVATSTFPADTRVSYEGYQVVRIVPSTEEELGIVQALLKTPMYARVDVWQEPSRPGKPIDVNVSPEMSRKLVRALMFAEIAHTIMIDDVQEAISRVEERHVGQDIVGSYVNYDTIVSWLNNMTKTNPKVTVQSYGKSLENRTLTVAKISNGKGTTKPIVFIEAGIHAREWISPATVIWMISQLATSNDPEFTTMLDAADWYIVPVANPDGYEYTQSTDRMWRKNRSVNKNSTCRGVDLNRNWDSHWMEVGASSDPCDDTFAGAAPFSEPETKALSQAIAALGSNVKAFFSFHSYSQMWLTPWAWTKNPPIDNAILMDYALKGAAALLDVNGTVYQVGSPAVILYAAAGGTYDWTKEKAGVQFSYTLELRDTGKFGFLLPADQILPSGKETWAGVMTTVKAVLNM